MEKTLDLTAIPKILNKSGLLDPIRETKSTFSHTIETAKLLKNIIESRFEESLTLDTIKKTIVIVQEIQKLLFAAHPLEFAIANIGKRVLSIIREQAKLSNIPLNIGQEDRFIKKLVSFKYEPAEDAEITTEKKAISSTAFLEFRTNVFDALEDLILDCENFSENINESAFNHISDNDTIISFGNSTAVASFLIEASKKRTFEVIITENSIDKSGENMAKTLAEKKISTVLISDASIYAVMSRVNKAIIGAEAIMANGGTLGASGSLLLAMAAKAHFVPLIVIAGAYKLTPHFPFEQDTFNELLNPGSIFDRNQTPKSSNINVIIPSLDYVAPEYISLYITNIGEHTPSYLYRLFAEYYTN